jgi:hypothetical protein
MADNVIELRISSDRRATDGSVREAILLEVRPMSSNGFFGRSQEALRLCYRGIHKFLRWAGVEDLRIHSIHSFITQEEMNK